MHDIVIAGGDVVDGTGADPRRADVAIDGTRITRIGDLAGSAAALTIDATHRLVLPGLIDAHCHADALLGTPRVQEAMLSQGVTTVILGQDGVSFAPTGPASARFVDRYFAGVNGHAPAALRDGATVAELLESWDRSGAINAAYLLPAGTIRAEAGALTSAKPDAEQRRAMLAAVERGLTEGAVGLSTGLDYVPGRFADSDEIAQLCVPVAEAGGVYVSHMRGYGSDTAVAALLEVAAIASATGARGHVSHLHGKASLIGETLAAIEAEGTQLTFDSYPYLRGNTILAMVALPPDLQGGGTDATLERLADRSVRARLADEWFPANSTRIASVTLSFLDHPDYRWAEGRSLIETAAESGVDLVTFVCDALMACDLAVGCVLENGPDRTDTDMRALLRHPSQLGSSDGIFLGSHPHPRAWGSFATALGRHVRELGDWSWGQAAWHLSGHTAERFGLAGRGIVSEGAIADLVLLDPTTVRARATYENPISSAVGVSHVVVGGELAFADGTPTASRAGRALRNG
jgi:N-acyl-D-amino-acid deacylase